MNDTSYLRSDGQQIRYHGFLPKWLGPYNIRVVHSGIVYMVDRDGTVVCVPAYDVKPAPPPDEPVPADIDIESPGDESEED